MRILVTGGSGFIGTRLVGELLAKGHEVRILDKVLSTRFPELCQVGDVRDPQALDTAVKAVDLVCHLAAEHRDDVSPISLYYDVNVDGTRNLAEACTANGVLRLIFTSSVAVYGLNAGTPSEDQIPNPFNDYGRSKLQAESVLQQWVKKHEGNTLTIVRPTVIFGEGNRGNVYNLVNQIASGRFMMVGKGENRKSMGYVGNIAAFLAFIGGSVQPRMNVYNYADKPDFSMNELIGLVRSFTGKHADSLVRIPYWLGMAGGACFDAVSVITGKKLPISAVRVKKFCATTTISVERLKLTGFAPPFTLEKGMEMFLDKEFGRTVR
jgi:nucleoside-diphosphate-sugar epimerase